MSSSNPRGADVTTWFFCRHCHAEYRYPQDGPHICPIQRAPADLRDVHKVLEVLTDRIEQLERQVAALLAR